MSRMFAPALLLALALLSAQSKGGAGVQADPKAGEAAKAQADAAKSALAELRAAYAKGKSEERIAALGKHASIQDPEVVAALARGLKDDDGKVVAAALDALRYNPHAASLDALIAAFERDKRIQKDPELAQRLVKAIGQHQSPAAVEKLAAAGLDGEGAVADARILALANVRSARSVELLIELSRGAADEKVAPRAEAIRLALARLVGEDLGTSRQRWQSWWNERRKGLTVQAQAPLLPKELQRRWDMFWGLPSDPGRAKPRGERGNDPEGRGG
jgi:hypothetical protein